MAGVPTGSPPGGAALSQPTWSHLRVRHLARRFVRAVSRAEPDPNVVRTARSTLSDVEFSLWSSMRVEDRRHSLEVLAAFDVLAPDADPATRAGVLLHDVGKLESDLGVLGRVAATLVGPRGRRFRRYWEHEAIGAAMLERMGSSAVTIAVVRGESVYASAVRRADDGC